VKKYVANGFVAASPQPTREEIRHAMAGNICRCGTYQRIVCAVQQAARVMSAPAKGANAE